MARSVLYINDALPQIQATLTDESGNPIDLTGYTVQFAMRLWYDAANTLGPNAAQIIGDPTLGTVQYVLNSTDLQGAVTGVYAAQWRVTDSSGNIMHVQAGEFEVRQGL